MIPNDNPLVPDYIEVFYAPVRDSLPVQVLLVALCMLIVCDLVFGMAAAAKAHEFKSEKVRQGLWHKAGELALVMLSMIIDALLLGGITIPFDVPNGGAIVAVSTALCVMEVMSLLEIAVKLNDQLAGLPVFDWLHRLKEADDGQQR